MKTKNDNRQSSGLRKFSEYYVPDELDEVDAEIDRQKVLADYHSRES